MCMSLCVRVSVGLCECSVTTSPGMCKGQGGGTRPQRGKWKGEVLEKTGAGASAGAAP